MSDKLFVGDLEDRKIKRTIEAPTIIDTDPKLLLSLSLDSSNMPRESSSKFTFKSLKAYEDSGFVPKPMENSNGLEVIKPRQHQFPCKFCDKKFPSSQALGGHQKAHRHERALLRMNKEYDLTTLRLGARMCPYSAVANHLPFHGLPLYHGAHMHPMAHMSAMPWHHFRHGYGNQGLHTTSHSRRQFRMASKSSGASGETPIFNPRDVGFVYELDQVPSLAGHVPNRAAIAHAALGGLQGNHYTRNQLFPSPGPNMSLNL